MSEPKWRNLPWSVDERNPTGVSDSEGFGIADCFYSLGDRSINSEGRVNARLIAAAPSLYEALARALCGFDPAKSEHKADCGCTGCQGFRALAKARGEET